MGAAWSLTAAAVRAGPVSACSGQAGSDAISYNDPGIVEWASGYSNYVEGSPIEANYTNPTACLGLASSSSTIDPNRVTQLGDGGQITLSFASPIIADGSGPDFAVFGNSFNAGYLKLAYVYVSENGTNWYLEPNTPTRRALSERTTKIWIPPTSRDWPANTWPATACRSH